MLVTFKEAIRHFNDDDHILMDKLRHDMLRKTLSTRETPFYPDIPLEDIRVNDMLQYMEDNFYGLKEPEFLSWFKVVLYCLEIGDRIHMITRKQLKANGVTKYGNSYVTFDPQNHVRFLITNIDYEICRMDGYINDTYKIDNVFCDEFKAVKCFFSYDGTGLLRLEKDIEDHLNKEFNLKDQHAVFNTTCGELQYTDCEKGCDELPF